MEFFDLRKSFIDKEKVESKIRDDKHL